MNDGIRTKKTPVGWVDTSTSPMSNNKTADAPNQDYYLRKDRTQHLLVITKPVQTKTKR